MKGMEGFMTLQELAQRLNLTSTDGLRHQIRRGVLSAEKIGTGAHAIWLITEEEADRYAREHRGRQGFASASHPLHGKRGGGGRRKRLQEPRDA